MKTQTQIETISQQCPHCTNSTLRVIAPTEGVCTFCGNKSDLDLHTREEFYTATFEDFISIRSEDSDMAIAVMKWNDDTNRTKANQKANAKYIVKAVKVLRALEMEKGRLENIKDMVHGGISKSGEHQLEMLNRIIKQAERD